MAQALPAQQGSTLKIFDSSSKKWITENLTEIQLNFSTEEDTQTLNSVLLIGETLTCEVSNQTIQDQKVPVQMILDFLQSRRVDAHCWLQIESPTAKSFSMRTYLE